jgi:hypothetical protein
MPFADQQPDARALDAFVALCGKRAWTARMSDLEAKMQPGSACGRATQQRHALELLLARLCESRAQGRLSVAERRICAHAQEAVRLAASLPAAPRARLRELVLAGLTGHATLIPLFHLLRVAARHRTQGFEVSFTGLAEGTPHDLLIRRDDVVAEVACETVSAEEGRHLHRGDWYALVDRINPDLQTWLAAHPGRYLLKMTLPEGLQGAEQLSGLHQKITEMLAAEKRQDAGAQAVLKLDPLMLAGAQAADRDAGGGLQHRLRAQFGHEAHLALTTDPRSGSVFVMAARAGRENEIAAAVCRRLALAAESRVSGGRVPAILAVFLDELDRSEWRALRERLELEGAVRRFLTTPAAKPVVAVSCASRMEMFGAAPPDGVVGGELRFRNPGHPAAKLPALAAAVSSSV